MKYILTLVFVLCAVTQGYCEKFQWVRVKYMVLGANDSWDSDLNFDMLFLKELEKYTTVKPEDKVNTATLEKIEELTKFPILYMHSESGINFNEIEVKNMKEYCLRGGFIWADDCVLDKSNPDVFFKQFVKTVETKVFPGKKMELLPMDHEIYHCHFDLPKGLPYIHTKGTTQGALGLSDEKGRLMMLATPTDIHCGWKKDPPYFSEKKTLDSYRMATNIVIYALTH